MSGRPLVSSSRIAIAFGSCLLFSLLAVSLDASAQIVNVQPLLKVNDAEGASGSLEQTLAWKTGNTQKLSVGGALALRVFRDRHLALFAMSGRYESTDEGAYDSQVMEHLRYRFDILDWLGAEAFVQHEFNEFRRLRVRALVGAGPRFELEAKDTFEVALGTAYMAEYERLDWATGEQGGFLLDAGEEVLNHRWSSYLSFNLVRDRFQLAQTTYVQPRFDDLEDLRLLAQLSIVLQLWKMLSLKVTGIVAYDTRPPISVDKLDTSLETSLGFVFGPFSRSDQSP